MTQNPDAIFKKIDIFDYLKKMQGKNTVHKIKNHRLEENTWKYMVDKP